MQTILNPVPVDVAQKELEAVAASLARTPRLEQLLRYMAKRYFDDQTDELTEYNIATEVFGRKKTVFIASEDAIARVETHRLRKRLTAYYEGPGRDHSIHISVPLGTYVPQFTEWSTPKEAAITDGPIGLMESKLPTVTPGADVWPRVAPDSSTEDTNLRGPESAKQIAFGSRRRIWIGLAALLFIGLVVAGLALRLRKGWSLAATTSVAGVGLNGAGATDSTKPGGAMMRTTSRAIPVALPFRMIAGYTGAPQRDNAGDAWQQDQFFSQGWPRNQSKGFIERTGNPFLFRYGREGDFSYDIPLLPGSYELHLYFTQGSDTGQSEDAENKAIFTVRVNDVPLLKNFDIVSDALGRNVADERVFRDISPGPDGKLHLQLTTYLGTPSLSALQILPNNTHKQIPMRLVMQPASYTDPHGQLWRPDDYYLLGRSLSHDLPGPGTDVGVLPFERYGHFQYALPVDLRDRYTLNLRFTELYFGAQGSDQNQDPRLFRVLCNGQVLLDDFDIHKEVGSFRTLQKTFHHLKPSAQGKLNLDFEPITNYATVSSIEVIDESN